MKVRAAVYNLCVKALSEALGFEMIEHIARLIFGEYRIHHRMGIQENIPITREMAADMLMRDVVDSGLFLALVERMMYIDKNGYMGRDYPIPRLVALVKAVIAEGFRYDEVSGLFMEHAGARTSSNWGRLQEDEEQQCVFLRLDIADNSGLVRANSKTEIDNAYGHLRDIVRRAVQNRLGRLWLWEGDGGLAAFLFSQKERAAVFAGMSILHEMFFYNTFNNKLSAPIRLRMAIHAGPVRYSSSPAKIKENETVREIEILENACTPLNNLSISSNIAVTFSSGLRELFGPDIQKKSFKFCCYTPGLIQA